MVAERISNSQPKALKDIQPDNSSQDRSITNLKIKAYSEQSNLTVKSIIDELHNAAPFQRDEIAKNYVGIKVTWEGGLWNVKKTSPNIIGDIVNVDIKPIPNEWHYSAFFNVPLKKYPQLRIAQQNDLIRVFGRIMACSSEGMYVELDVDRIEFIEKQQSSSRLVEPSPKQLEKIGNISKLTNQFNIPSVLIGTWNHVWDYARNTCVAQIKDNGDYFAHGGPHTNFKITKAEYVTGTNQIRMELFDLHTNRLDTVQILEIKEFKSFNRTC